MQARRTTWRFDTGLMVLAVLVDIGILLGLVLLLALDS